MKIRAEGAACGCLVATSAVDWATCLSGDKVVYDTDNNVLVGKQLDAGTYNCWQSFLRFDGSGIPASHEIVSATLRLYIYADNSDADFDVVAKIISTYDTLDATDWKTSPGPPPAAQFTASTEDIATDTDGYSYLDLELSATALASISTTTTFDMIVMHNTQSDEPTGDEYIILHKPGTGHATPMLYLEVVTRSQREQTIVALKTRLETIDEYSGYNTTPATVSRRPLSFATLEATQFPAAFLWPLTDAETDEGTLAHRAANWDIQIHAGIYEDDPDEASTTLEEFISDLQRVTETDFGSANPLGLSFLNSIDVISIDTSDGVIDDNRASAVLTVRFNYFHELNES